MTIGTKEVVYGATAIGVVTLLSGLAVHFQPQGDDPGAVLRAEEIGGAIPGRIVNVPAKDYNRAFKIGKPKLGDCAFKIINKKIQICNERFSGTEMMVPRGFTGVASSRIESTEDIFSYGMGGVGVNVGVCGLVSAGVKVNVAVTTQTNKRTINLMSSYEIQRGMFTLQHPKPETAITGQGALYLSEIELGGNEMFMVSMEFESESKKTEVTITVKFKILFISISYKISFVKTSFSSSFSSSVKLVSSFRDDIYESFGKNDMAKAVEEVKRVENLYVEGPTKLRELKTDDVALHYTYYFAAWLRSPFAHGLNSAVANNDVNTLTQQSTEVQAVRTRIKELLQQTLSGKVREQLVNLQDTLMTMSKELDNALVVYHTATADERNKMKKIYGEDKAPNYYQRQLRYIVGY